MYLHTSEYSIYISTQFDCSVPDAACISLTSPGVAGLLTDSLAVALPTPPTASLPSALFFFFVILILSSVLDFRKAIIPPSAEWPLADAAATVVAPNLTDAILRTDSDRLNSPC